MQHKKKLENMLSGDRPDFYGAALQVPLDLPWSQYMCNGWGNESLDLCFPMHFESCKSVEFEKGGERKGEMKLWESEAS